MAVTASAAAALLGGVALDPGAISGYEHGHGGLATSSLMDDGADYADSSFLDYQSDRCATFEDSGQLECAGGQHPGSSGYSAAIHQQH
jgi:hypothetical protein